MRIGIIISGTLHVAAIGATIIGLPLFNPPLPPEEQPLLVDLVTIADETTSKPQPKTEAEDKAPPAPAEKAEALPPQPAPKPEPKPEPVVEKTEPPAAPVKPKELVAPPAPEPDPVAAKPPAPEPPKPAPEPEAVVEKAEPVVTPPEPEAKPTPEPSPEPETPAPFADAPQPKLKPKLEPKPEPKPEPKRPSFDLNRIAALLDKSQKEPSVKRRASDAPSNEPAKPVQQARISDRPLTMSEIDAIRYQIEQCWSVPAGARDAEDLIVRIKVFLNPDGTLSRPPEIVNDGQNRNDSFYRTAAESARRAVQKCAPLKNLPTDRYALWRELTLVFNPRQMLGG